MRRLCISLAILLLPSFALALDHEVCGNGYDDAASGHTYGACPAGWMNAVFAGTGCDNECPGADKDMDGYSTDTDCDDTNKRVYPGAITTGTSANHYRFCQSNGTYSTSTAVSSFVCPGGGTAYFVSTSGNNSNSGTYASPKRDYLWFSNPAATGYVALAAGDCVVFLNGTYSGTWDDSGTTRAWYFTRDGGVSTPIGFYADPNGTVTIDLATSPTEVVKVEFNGSDYIVFDRFEVTGDFGLGVRLASLTNAKLRSLHVYDNDCNEDNNCTGIGLNTTVDVSIEGSNIHDNFERGVTDGNDENDTQIVSFTETTAPGDNVVRGNSIWVTAATSDTSSRASCVKQKRGNSSGTFLYEANVFWNCAHTAIGVSNASTTIRRNRFYDSENVIAPRNFGGSSVQCQIGGTVIEDNLIDESYPLVLIQPESCTYGTFTQRRNVWLDNRSAAYNSSNPFFYLGANESNAIYDDIVVTSPLWTIEDECYFNKQGSPPTIQFCLFCGGESSGGMQTLAQMQALATPLMVDSFIENPTLDSDDVATSTNCSTFGQFAGTTTTTTVSTTTTTTAAPAGNGRATVLLKR